MSPIVRRLAHVGVSLGGVRAMVPNSLDADLATSARGLGRIADEAIALLEVVRAEQLRRHQSPPNGRPAA